MNVFLRMPAVAVAGLFALVSSALAHAVPPGEYITQGGWGWMSIAREPAQSPAFELYSHGPNAHLCSLVGEVDHDVVLLDPGGGEPICRVSLHRTTRGVLVGSEGSCRGYCGMRAGFDGEYLLVPRACTRGAKEKVRDRFRARYRAAAYREAIAVLLPVLTGCAETLEPSEAAHLRNDLAVAYFHAHERRACLEVLKPLIGAEADRQFVEQYWLPAEHETWTAIRAAAQTNVGLCSSPT